MTIFRLLLKFCPVLLLGAVACKAPEAASLTLENDRLRLELVDASEHANVRTTGLRFLRAGWLKRLRVKGTDQEFFRSRTVHPRLPAFGMPFEFFPGPEFSTDPETGGIIRLQYGVGVIEQEAGNRFEAVPVRLFSWRCSLRNDNGNITLTARQISGKWFGYAYELVVRVILEKQSNSVIYEFDMRNVGEQTIRTEFYAHPFFASADGFFPSRFRFPGDSASRCVAETPGDLEISGSHLPDGANWAAAGNFTGNGESVVIRTDSPLSRIVFWKNRTDCFAVEPYIAICIPPNKRNVWRYVLTVDICGRAGFIGQGR